MALPWPKRCRPQRAALPVPQLGQSFRSPRAASIRQRRLQQPQPQESSSPIRMSRRPGRGRGHARAQADGLLALAARRHDGRHDRAVHQPAVHAALLRRLHAAQHGVLLPPVLCMLPFTFLHLSGKRARTGSTGFPGTTCAVPRDGRRLALPDVQRAQGGRTRLGVRRRAHARERRRPRHVGAADGGAAPHGWLEPAA